MDNIGRDFRASLLGVPNHDLAFSVAPMWKRAVSFIMDLLLVNFFLFVPFQDSLTSFVTGKSLDALGSITIPASIYASIFFMSIICLLYFSLFQHYFQQTFGMMLMKLYVLPKPGFWKAVGRNLFILPFFPFNLFWIADPLYLYFKNKRLLEHLTGTSTVERQNA